MTIAPLPPEKISEVVRLAFDDMQLGNKAKSRYRNLNDDQRAELHQLCWFLSFYISEALGENIQDEVDALVTALREASELPDLNDLDRSPINEALAGLRQLKAGGLTPGDRIPAQTVSQFVYPGSRVIARSQPGEIFMVSGWTPTYSHIRITNGVVEADLTLKDLIFLSDGEKAEAGKATV